MVKCEACERNLCNRKYDNRDKCLDKDNCTCTCQQKEIDTGVWGCLSVIGGVAAFAGGFALTIATGGLGGVGIACAIGGSVISSVGASAAIQPIEKKINGERMTAGDYCTDVGISAAIGLATGGIGSLGSWATTSLAKKVGETACKRGLVKLGTRSATGALSGATTSVIEELKSPRDFKLSKAAKSLLTNTIIGAATGGVGHVAGNASKAVTNGVLKSTTKVAVEATGAAIINSTCQGYEMLTSKDTQFKVDQLLLKTATHTSFSAIHEGSKNCTYKAHGGKNKLLRRNYYIKKGLNSSERKAAENVKQYADAHPDEILHELNNAVNFDEHSEIKKYIEMYVEDIEKELEMLKQKKTVAKNEGIYEEIKKIQELDKRFKLDQKKLNKDIDDNISERRKFKRQNIGDYNIHALNERPNQIAGDIPDPTSAGRGKKRVVFNIEKRENGEIRTHLAGYHPDHKYKEIPHTARKNSLIKEFFRMKPKIRDIDSDSGTEFAE